MSSILIDEAGNSKDITILEIVNFIVNKEGHNVIIIFPNCSPFGDASYTSETERNMWNRIKPQKINISVKLIYTHNLNFY